MSIFRLRVVCSACRCNVMTSTDNTPFHLQGHLDQLYDNGDRQFTFRASDQQAFARWQAQFRVALKQCLAVSDDSLPENPSTRLLSSTNKGTYTEEKYALNVGDVLAPMYMLIPNQPSPYVPVLAFHGHGSGVQLILGNDAAEIQAREQSASDDNFAQRLAEDGYLVCALEQRGFGERVTDRFNNDKQNACRHLAFEYMLNGQTLLGKRIQDAMIAINYLQQRADVHFDLLASVGFSGGGTTALFLSVLDERIHSTIVASYFCAFKQSILGVAHCECNYVPGILTLGEIGDITALIAPRNLCIISGERDPIFPIDGVKSQLTTVERAYALLNATNACTCLIHDGAHVHRHDLCSPWLNAHTVK